MVSFTLKVAGDAGIYSVQEADLVEVILKGWPQGVADKAKADQKIAHPTRNWPEDVAGPD